MTGPPILSCAGVKVLVDLLKATSDDSIIQKVPIRLSLSNKFYLQEYLWCVFFTDLRYTVAFGLWH